MLVSKNTPRSKVFRLLGVQLSLIPLKENKSPKASWKQSQSEIIPYDYEGDFAGLVCGTVSGHVEAIDFDLKYDQSGDLFQSYCKLMESKFPGILSKLVIQTTKSKGYHFVYRCSEIQGNQVLAKRQDGKALIETRGEGGYIVIAPSPNYELVQGTFLDIPEITPLEREALFQIAESFNQYKEPEKKPEKVSFATPDSNSPFRPQAGTHIDAFGKFCQVVPIIDLLLASGWDYAGEAQGRSLVKRPGESDAGHSGNIKDNLFRCHSTSTEFHTDKTYNPVQAFAMLRYGTLDLSAAGREIHKLGFGKDRYTDSELIQRAVTAVKGGLGI